MSNAGTPLSALIVEDSVSDAGLVVRQLERGGFAVSHERVDSTEAMRAALQKQDWDIVLSDFNIPGFGAGQALDVLHQSGHDIPCIVISGVIQEATAVELMRMGAHDYLMKGELARLVPAVQRELAEARDRAEHRRAQQAVIAREREISGILENMQDVYFRVDLQGHFLLLSSSAHRLYGYDSHEDMMGACAADLYAKQEDRAKLLQELSAKGYVYDYEGAACKKDGSNFWVSINAQYFRDEKGEAKGMEGVVRDISERRAAQTKILKLSRMYAALSECNEAIVRCSNQEELFQSICRSVVEAAATDFAWIGLVNSSSGMVLPVAHFGVGDEYIRDIQISTIAGDPFGEGPTGMAIREDRPYWCRDFVNDPRTEPWHERAKTYGWRSSAVLPLHRKGVAVGALTLYLDRIARQTSPFRAERIARTSKVSFLLFSPLFPLRCTQNM